MEQSLDRSARVFLISFISALAVTVLALVALRLMSLSDAVLRDPEKRWALGVLPGDEVIAIKLNRAKQVPPYDVGLFGNSRIMMVGADDLGLPGKRVFNFSIGGSSIRQSIRLLEELHAMGKAPAIAIISVDHAELGMPSIAGGLPWFPFRWIAAAEDVRLSWSRQGVRGAAVEAINWLATEPRVSAITFNRVYVSAKARALSGEVGPLSPFRPDGSHLQVPTDKEITIALLPDRADTYPQLESDFTRLVALRQSGMRIIVYESPVAPGLGRTKDEELSANARNVRGRLQRICTELGYEYHRPPSLAEGRWIDRDHPPARPLARWLATLI